MVSPHRQHAPVTAFSPTLARYRREDATKLQNIYENQNENEKYFDSPPYESQGARARNKKAVSGGYYRGKYKRISGGNAALPSESNACGIP